MAYKFVEGAAYAAIPAIEGAKRPEFATSLTD